MSGNVTSDPPAEPALRVDTPVQIALVPFGERALRHFIYLELPEGMALDDAAGFAAARHALSQRAGLGTLAPLAEKLESMSQDIAAHASKRPADGSGSTRFQTGASLDG